MLAADSAGCLGTGELKAPQDFPSFLVRERILGVPVSDTVQTILLKSYVLLPCGRKYSGFETRLGLFPVSRCFALEIGLFRLPPYTFLVLPQRLAQHWPQLTDLELSSVLDNLLLLAILLDAK